jgi:DNA-binding NarL/FixJ family response regulator
MTIRTAIFDNNKNVRNNIISLLSTDPVFEIVGSFSDASDCVQQVIHCNPDVVLIDIEMPGANGINVISLLIKETPQVQILVQSSFEDDDRVFNTIRAGASGFILKNHINGYLIKALKDLRTGGAPMSPSIARKVLNMLRREQRDKCFATTKFKLTDRELDILKEIINGRNYKMISEHLQITQNTVRRRMKQILEKLNVVSRAEAVAKAIQQKIV